MWAHHMDSLVSRVSTYALPYDEHSFYISKLFLYVHADEDMRVWAESRVFVWLFSQHSTREGKSNSRWGKIVLYSTPSRDRAKVIRWEIFSCYSLMMLDEQAAACCVLVWHHITVWSKVGEREWFDLTLCIVGARVREKKLRFAAERITFAQELSKDAHTRVNSTSVVIFRFRKFLFSLLSSFRHFSLFSLESRTTARTISQQSFIILVCLFPMPTSFVSQLSVYMQMIFRPWFSCCWESFGTMTTTTNIYSLFTVSDEEKPSPPPPLLLCFVAVFIPEFTSHSNFYLVFQNSRKLSTK